MPLHPVQLLNRASAMPVSRARRIPGSKSSAKVPDSAFSDSRISFISACANSFPSIRARMEKASSNRPSSASQRGLCGTRTSSTMNTTTGTATEASINRQLMLGGANLARK